MYRIEPYLCGLGTHTYACFKVVTLTPKIADFSSLYFTTLQVWEMFEGTREAEALINSWLRIADVQLSYWSYEGTPYTCLSEHQFTELLIWLVQMRYKSAEEMFANLVLSHLAAR